MSTINYSAIVEQVRHIASKAGKYIQEESVKFRQSDIELKGEHDYVTYVDKNAEALIVEGLRPLISGAGFITEEDTASHQNEYFKWIIDPLDGTTNFIHGIPLYCVSIALMEGNEVVVGVVYEINLDECFYAWKGGEARLNGEKISVSKNTDFDTALLATGFPYYDYGRLDAYLKVFEYLMRHTAGLRRLGSAAADLAYVACGRFEGFYEYGLNAWDVAAGAFIVEMAGGKVTGFTGERNFVFGRELLAGNTSGHNGLLKVMQQFF
ncbi:MAG: inositol monophosphatase family protein [Lentimicrobium sp.]|jgi:myo-inositol-1(or 4)-monophosphatase|nr:inositol monophosphatase family protein [Lentimicrobium sp.]